MRAHDQIGVDEHAQVPNRTNRVHKMAANGQRRRWQLLLKTNGCNPQHLCLVGVQLEPVRLHLAGDQIDATCDILSQRWGLSRLTRTIQLSIVGV
jgi:hypothetical protein